MGSTANITLLSFVLTLQNERQGQTSTAATLGQANGFVKLALTGQMKLIQNDLSSNPTNRELEGKMPSLGIIRYEDREARLPGAHPGDYG